METLTSPNNRKKLKRKAADESDDILEAFLRRSKRNSLQSATERKSSTGDVNDAILKQNRESTLWQMIRTDEEERDAHAPEESRRLLNSVAEAGDNEEDVGPVKFFTHELSIRGRLRRVFIRNPSTRLASTFFDLIVKVLVCAVYALRVILDDSSNYACNGSPCHKSDNTSSESDGDNMVFSTANINWYVLVWVHRPLALWIVELVLAAMTLLKDLLFIYIATKGHRLEQVLTSGFLLEIVCSVPMLATVTYPPLLQNLFVPTFLNCWLAKRALHRIFNDLHLTRQRFQTISVTLSQQMILLIANLLCLVFTTICGIQHIQRGSANSPLTLFESFYFVIVTFSTVGYGDISPDIWLGQFFMILMMVVALSFVPRQIEGLASTWLERQKVGGEYSVRTASRNKHVIVCSTSLTQETVMDFLNEFYAHPKLEEHMVILLCPQELDSSMQVILKDPKWAHRVIYMKGSALKDIDLKRCRLVQAEACFFLAPRPASNKDKADQHTILRSWAVKDFAPHCKQYIQLFKGRNKMHVKFAEHVVCEDEFKYALLANNCLYPGLSTLVSLLVHTSSGLLAQFLSDGEGDLAPHPWQQTYGHHSGNEIYHIQLHKSIFFSRYEGYRFTQASAEAHQRFGVTLMAVLDGDSTVPRRLQLNPGSDYILKKDDFCFYMSITREEYSDIPPEALVERPSQTKLTQNLELIAEALQKYHDVEGDKEVETDDQDVTVFDTITSLMGRDISHLLRRHVVGGEGHIKSSVTWHERDGEKRESVIRSYESARRQSEDVLGLKDVGIRLGNNGSLVEMDHRHDAGKVLQFYNDMGKEKLTTGPPPVTIYMGSRRAVCHIMREPRPLCCLEWGVNCVHCQYKNANDERWHHQLILMAAQNPSSGINNFIVPLRSSFIAVNGLSPIVLLLENEPSAIFLDTIARFPLVYWMKGSIKSLDDLLMAGINKASHLVVVNRESQESMTGEETLADSETIMAVQTVFRMFPNANIVTELSQASNMRFMQFSAQDIYSQKVSHLEQKLKETLTSNLSHIFRLPFAAGQVFSASMLDTLLYQTFVKGYLITFVRLLLGMDAEEGSGHLSSIRVKRATIERFGTYGELYQGLCSATGEIPIAVYRTERQAGALKPMPGEVCQSSMDCLYDSPSKKKKKSATKKTSLVCNPFVAFNNSESVDIGGLVRNRLRSLDMSLSDYSEVKKRPNSISYVIANPAPKRKLKVGDIVYVIQPSSMKAKPSKQKSWITRSHSFSGPVSSKFSADSPSVSLQNAAPQNEKNDEKIKQVGRFKLKRCTSDKQSQQPKKEPSDDSAA
ncbi:potassium channel subfamily T member 2-like isoform X3 [Pomacea canaliculata]|uniref:potassium channel subfamily T member 2-like isoform X3 n=1 Tax=Pomacea canaliculata TaxID=400727 RepID=UPI000D7303FD|nr:potassium channel subfamily T member 2-like isoform X3 [Pomacea canaliculata]